MRKSRSARLRIGASVAAAVAAVMAGGRTAAAQDAFIKYYSTSNAMGGFSPNAAGDTFYQANFPPNAGFTKWSLSGAIWSSTLLVGPTDMQTYGQSDGLAGSGSLPSSPSGGGAIIGDLVLNPAPITILRDGVPTNFAAGTLGFVVDQPTNVLSGTTIRYDLTKIGYFYDLRQIGAATGGVGVDRNANGTVDWNDVFEPLFSKADMRSKVGYSGTGTGVTTRHFAFSSNGQSVYFVDSSQSSITGGLWKVNLTTPGAAGLSRILTNPTSINTEPSVIPSSVRNFGGGTGDQVIVQGAANFATNPNGGGISYVVDDGTTVSGPQTLLTAKQIQAYTESATTPNVFSTAADAAGSLYVFNSANDGVFKYDTAGRLSKVFSRAEQIAFDTTTGGGSSSTATTVDMKVRDVTYAGPGGPYTVGQLLYSDTTTAVRAPVGIHLFTPGDFNRDNAMDAADVTLFKAKLGLRGVVAAGVGNTTPFAQTNGADLKFDLNGSTLTGGINGVAIDWKDVKIFQQFSGLSAGDVDMDFDVDATDLNTLAASYNGANNKLFTDGNLTSVRIAAADRDAVNFADLVTLAASWTAAKPALAAVGSIPQADLDRAFAISATGTISEYVATGSGTWGTTSAWSNSIIPDAPGAVASLLTKTQNDVVITVDDTTTVGQLNFDSYFNYTIDAVGAGALSFDNGGGLNAEVNTFAASPTINAPVVFVNATDVTVNSAQDALTIAGNTGGGGALAKKGEGTLVLSGIQGYTGATSVAAGKLLLQANLTSSPAVSVTGGTLELASGGGSNRVIRTGAVTITGAGRIDLRDNKLIAVGGDVGTWDGSAYTGVSGMVDSGRGIATNAQWNGGGIVTSDTRAVNNNDLVSIGVARVGEFKNIAATATTTVAGQTVAGSDVIAMVTWGGDANLDGKINVDDYGQIDFNVSSSGSVFGWYNGDFNYDGKINIDDYGIIDFNVGAQTGQFATANGLDGVTAIPEPTFLAAGGLAILTCRRRRR